MNSNEQIKIVSHNLIYFRLLHATCFGFCEKQSSGNIKKYIKKYYLHTTHQNGTSHIAEISTLQKIHVVYANTR
jgi:hypothetical protein